MYIYKKVNYYIDTTHNVLTKEIPLILPDFQEHKRVERGIVTSLVAGFIVLGYEGILIYFHNKSQNALQKAFGAMENM